MPDDSISVLIAADVSPLTEGMKKGAAAVGTFAEEVEATGKKTAAAFNSATAASVDAVHKVEESSEASLKGFAKMSGGGIFAFDALRAKLIEATAEVGKLRAEILQTDDQAKLAQLRSALAQAQAQMTAARIEMRALRMESAEATEKANLLAESFGGRIPGALGHLLGRIPAVQTAMSAVFAVAVVGIFIDTLLEIPEVIGKIIDKFVEWDEFAKKTYQEQIRLNREIIAQNVERANKERELQTIGTEGMKRSAIELENLKKHQQDIVKEQNTWREGLRSAEEELKKLKGPDLREQLEAGKGPTEIWGGEAIRAIENWALRGKERIKELESSVEDLNKRIAESDKELRDMPVAFQRIGRTDVKEAFDRMVAASTAAIEAQKRGTESYLSFFEAGLKQELASHHITKEQEVDGEIAALQARLEAARKYAEERLAILKREAATGKDVTPETTRVREDLASKELETQSKINTIRNTFRLEERRHAEEVSVAGYEAARSGAEAEANLVKQTARDELESRKINIDQYVAKVKESNAEVIKQDLLLLDERLRVAREDPRTNQAQIIGLEQQVADLHKKQLAEEAALDAEAARKNIEDAKKQADQQLSLAENEANQVLEASRRADALRLRDHAVSLSQWAALEKAALDKWNSAETAALESDLETQKRLFGEGSEEYQKVLNKMREQKLKWSLEVERIDDQVAQRFQQSMNVIGSSFTSSFDRMLSEHTKFSSVMISFWDEMVRGWARMGLQIVGNYIQSLAQIILQETLAALKINVIHTQGVTFRQATENVWKEFKTLLGIQETAQTTAQQGTQTAAVTAGIATRQAAEAAAVPAAIATEAVKNAAIVSSAAGAAGAAAFASVMEALPFPANIATAPGVMAEAVSITLSNLALATAERGALLDRDTLVAAHAQEMILPAHISVGLDSMIKAGAVPTYGVPALSSGPSSGYGTVGVPSGSVSPASSTTTNHNIQHNHFQIKVDAGRSEADLQAAIHTNLVPAIKRAMRNGQLP